MKLINKVHFLIVFFLCLDGGASDQSFNNDPTNNSTILSFALQNNRHDVVNAFLADEKLQVDAQYVDRGSHNNLLFLFIQYISELPSDDFDNLESYINKFLTVLTKSEESLRFVSDQKPRHNLFTLMGEKSSKKVYELVKNKLKDSFYQKNKSNSNGEGSISLHYALQRMNHKLVKFLLNEKVNIAVSDRLGLSVFYVHLANYKKYQAEEAMDSWQEIFNLILDESDNYDNREVLNLPIKLPPSKYYLRAIHVAAANDDLKIFQAIENKIGNTFSSFKVGNTGGERNTLSIAIENNSVEIMGYLFSKLKELAPEKKKSVLSVLNSKGENLYHLAIKKSSQLAVDLLLSDSFIKYTKINLLDLEGNRPLDLAFNRIRKPEYIINAIMNHPDLDLMAPLKNGKDLFSNLVEAEALEGLKVYLNRFKPDWNSLTTSKDPLFLKILSLNNLQLMQVVMKALEQGSIDLTLSDSKGSNILHYLVFYGGVGEIVKNLYKTNSELFFEKNHFGHSPLLRSAIASTNLIRSEDEGTHGENNSLLLLSLSDKYDLNVKDLKSERNIAHYAILNNNNELFEYLIKNQKELFFIVDSMGNSSLHMATMNNSAEMVKALIDLENIKFKSEAEKIEELLSSAITSKNVEEANRLINDKKELELSKSIFFKLNSKQETAIELAFQAAEESGNLDILEVFIKEKKQLDIYTKEGLSVMEMLLSLYDTEELVESLVGLRPGQSQEGLIFALEYEDFGLIDYFLELGADPNLVISRGKYIDKYPVMVPVIERNSRVFYYFLTGVEQESFNLNEAEGESVLITPSRENIELQRTDSLNKSLFSYIIDSQSMEMLQLFKFKSGRVDFGNKVEGSNHYLSHNLIYLATFTDFNLGSEDELKSTEKFIDEILKADNLNPNVLDRDREHWLLLALKNKNGVVVSRALNKWPELLKLRSNDMRAIDLILKNSYFDIVANSILVGMSLNDYYNFENEKELTALKEIFLYWGSSDRESYESAIQLGLDADILLDVLDGLFERDELLNNLELASEDYLKRCRAKHKEQNQEFKRKSEDHFMYPFTKTQRRCLTPNFWLNLIKKDNFDVKKIKL